MWGVVNVSGVEKNTDTDFFEIAGEKLSSRLFVGTGKYPSDELISAVCTGSSSEVITVALRRVDLHAKKENVMDYIPKHMRILANTSGARTADEAVRLARLARSTGCGNWIKIEVISDSKYLLPDGYETVRATEILANEGFAVFPYVNADLYIARALVDAGAAAIMPLGSPIGTNRGLQTKEMIRILIEEIKLPIIVDAGIGKPSQACEAMEMGASACLVNTAIASAQDVSGMAHAFAEAVRAGRKGYLSGFASEQWQASASSPQANMSSAQNNLSASQVNKASTLTGFLDENK